MAVEKGRVGDEPLFKVRFMEDGDGVDVSSWTGLKIKIAKPSGTTEEKSATFTNDGSDGWVEYQTASGDIDAAGTYTYAGKGTDESGHPFETDTAAYVAKAAL